MEDLRLIRDTGVDGDRVTANPTLAGRVVPGASGRVIRVEFDHFADGDVDGYREIADGQGDFTYDPRSSDLAMATYTGKWSVRYRLVWESAVGGLIFGDWQSFTCTLLPAPVAQWQVVNLAHRIGRGSLEQAGVLITGHVQPGSDSAAQNSSGYEDSYWDDGSSDTAIWAFKSAFSAEGLLEPGSTGGLDWEDVSLRFSADFPIAPNAWMKPAAGPLVNVEVDFDGDGVSDGTTFARDLRFEYWAAALRPGTHTIRARATEWNSDYGMLLYGNWTTYVLQWLPASPPIIALGLENDTGYSRTDRVTSDPAIVGKLPTPLPEFELLQVQYDIGRDGTVDGWTTVDKSGSFRFVPVGLSIGSVSLQARTYMQDPVAGKAVAGPWHAFAFCYVAASVPTIAELRLLSDVGESDVGRNTSVSTIVGRLAGSDVGGRLVEFDHDGDERAEGTATSDSQGNFTYVPAGLSAGPVTIRGRTSQWNEYESRQEYGAWRSLSFELVVPETEALSVRDLRLASDTGTSASDRVTSDPTLVGQLSGAGPWAQRLVEFDLNQDGVPDGSVLSDDFGRFEYTPTGLAAGRHRVQARGVQFDYASRLLTPGAWSSLDFTLEPSEDAAPRIVELRLLSDSGVSPEDLRTENVALAGVVHDPFGTGPFTVQFDDNGDGVVDDTCATDADGAFLYVPQLVSYGPVKVQARVAYWDWNSGGYAVQPWTSIEFVYEDQPEEAARLLDVSAASLAGTSAPTIRLAGRITNESEVSDVAVEIDVDGDDQLDFSTRTDAWGNFRVDVSGLGFGEHVLRLRTRELDAATQQYQFGQWLPITVVHAAPESAAAPIIALELVHDTGASASDRITVDPRVRGVLADLPLSAHARVEFDHDQDGVADGAVAVDGDRTFQYTPTGLEPGPITLRARTRDYDSRNDVLHSDWTDLRFTLQPGTAAGLDLEGLRLVHDSGASNSDRSTSDPRITGRALAPGGQAVVVEFDHDGDGIVDGMVGTQDGYFTYQPQGLSPGWVPLAARIRSEIGGLSGQWTTFGFVYSTDPDGPEAQALAAAVRSLDADAQTAQETLAQELRRANRALDEAAATAQAEFERRVLSAEQAQREADEAAQQRYNRALAAAEVAYVGATQRSDSSQDPSAEGAGEASLSSVRSTFQWPQNLPALPGGWSLDASSAPLLDSPAYAGPPYDFAADPAYQAAITASQTALDEAIQAAEVARNRALKTARDDYDKRLRDATGEVWDQTQQTQTTVATPNPETKLQAAIDTYNAAVQRAQDGYHAALQSIAAVTRQALTVVGAPYSNTMAAIRSTYAGKIKSAREAYDRARATAMTCQQQISVFVTYAQAVHAAGKDRDRESTEVKYTFDQRVSEITREHQSRKAAAARARDEAISAAILPLDSALAQFDIDQRHAELDRWLGAERNRAQRERQAAWTAADALRTYQDDVARAERDHATAVADAQSAHAKVTAEAKVVVLAAWDASERTAWSAFQLALATNAKAAATQLADAGLVHARAVAKDELERASKRNEAERDYSRAMAALQCEEAEAIAAAKHEYWRKNAAEQLLAAQYAAAERSYLRNELAAFREYHTTQVALGGERLAKEYSTAGYRFALAEIAARTLTDLPEDCFQSFGISFSGVPNSSAYERQPYVESATNWSERRKAENVALYNLELHNISLNQSVIKEWRRIAAAYQANLEADLVQRSQGYAGNLQAYHEALARSGYRTAVGVARIEGAQADALADAEVQFTYVVSQVDFEYVQYQLKFENGQRIDDARAELMFRSDVAREFAAVSSRWDAAESDFATRYSLALANAEVDWVTSTGTSSVTYVQAIQAADTKRGLELATAERDRARRQSQAYRQEVISQTKARNTFAANLGQARLDYAIALAGAEAAHTGRQHDLQLATNSENRAFYHTFGTDDVAAEAAYQTGMAGAWLAFDNAGWDAARDLAIAQCRARDESLTPAESAEIIKQASAEHAAIQKELAGILDATARELWETLRQARADGMRREILHHSYSRSVWFQTADADELLYVGVMGEAATTLAGATRQAATDFAKAIGQARQAFGKEVALSEQDYQLSITKTQAGYETAATSAAAQEDLDEFDAQTKLRIATVDAAGVFVRDYQSAMAANVRAGTAVLGLPHSTFESQVWNAAADWNDSMRVAQIDYERALRQAGRQHLADTSSANFALASTLAALSIQHASSVGAATAHHTIARTAADAKLHLAAADVDADFAEQEVLVRVEYDHARAAARANLQSRLNSINETYYTAIGNLRAQYYLDATRHWMSLAETPLPLDPNDYLALRALYVNPLMLDESSGWSASGYVYIASAVQQADQDFGPIIVRWVGQTPERWSRWAGWGLGYSWDFEGWDNNRPNETSAFETYQANTRVYSLNKSAETRDAHLAYIRDIGDALTRRAEQLGDAEIARAVDRGAALSTFDRDVDRAEKDLQVAIAQAADQRGSQLATTIETHAAALGQAHTAQTRATGVASIRRQEKQGAAEVARATAVATAEAHYLGTLAAERADKLSHAILAGAMYSPDLLAQVTATSQWMTALRQPHIEHATALAEARAEFALEKTKAQAARHDGQAAGESQYVESVAKAENRRAAASSQNEAARDNDLAGIERLREYASIRANAEYRTALAEAQKTFAMAYAQWTAADETRRVAENWDTEAIEAHRMAWAAFERDRKTAGQDARYAWQQADIGATEAYVTAQNGVEQAYTVRFAELASAYDQSVASAEHDRRLADATLDARYWDAVAGARSRAQNSEASADVTRWTAEAEQRVAAQETLDGFLHTRNTERQLDAARVKLSSWLAAAPEYTRLAQNKSSATQDYQAAVSRAYVAQEQDLAQAAVAHAKTVADAGVDQAKAVAQVTASYHNTTVPLNGALLHRHATIELTYGEALVQASFDQFLHADAARYKADRDKAAREAKRARGDAEQAFLDDEAAAFQLFLEGVAAADLNETTAILATDKALAHAKATAQRNYRQRESEAYVTEMMVISAAQANYWRWEADSLDAAWDALALNRLASQTTRESEKAAAYAHWTAVAAEAQREFETDQAQTQQHQENERSAADEERTMSIENARAQYGTAAAQAAVNWHGSQAAVTAARANRGVSTLQLPTLGAPREVPFNDEMLATFRHAYAIDILAVENSGWHAARPSYVQLWDQTVSEWWWVNFDHVRTDAEVDLQRWQDTEYHTGRQPLWEPDFWLITTVADGIQSEANHWTRYYREQTPAQFLSSPESRRNPLAAQALFAPVLPTDTKYDPVVVAALLRDGNEDVADYWKTRGLFVSSPEAQRGTPAHSPTGIADDPDSKRTVGAGGGQSLELLPLYFPNGWDSTQAAEVIQDVVTSDHPQRFGATNNAHQQFLQWSEVGPTTSYPRHASKIVASPQQRQSMPRDEIIVTESKTVVWTSRSCLAFKDTNNRVTLKFTPFPKLETIVGQLRADGWVYFEDGGRYTLTALKKVVTQYRRATHAEIVDTLNAIRSPFRIDAQTNQLGIFIGGTYMHFNGLGNVERMYNLYQGTKFYYGGIGNSIDFSSETVRGAIGWGWDAILDRAEADIQAQYRPGMKIHLFGFSRGAAMCNELAKRLGAKGISIDFIGLFDPVYSHGFLKPGQDSNYVETTPEGLAGNYVTATIGPLVKNAAVLYSVNEDRSWFPATRFRTTGPTRLDTMKSPGGHAEIGGHWQNNLNVQQLNLRAMIEFARGHGGVNLQFNGVEPAVAQILASTLAKKLAFEDVKERDLDHEEKNWAKASNADSWNPYDQAKYIDQLNESHFLNWIPYGYSAQKWSMPNPMAARNLVDGPLQKRKDPNKQPLYSHYPRDLSWVRHELFDLYPKGYVDDQRVRHVVSRGAIEHIRSLYLLKIDPGGGWVEHRQPKDIGPRYYPYTGYSPM